MSETPFRGKRIDNGGWAYGFIWHNDIGDCFIRDTTGESEIDYKVDESTICEYLNIKDKKERKMFKHDIILKSWSIFESYDERVLLVFSRDPCGLICVSKTKIYQCIGSGFKKIGNIYDNPELFGGNDAT